ncbi:J domain-containing protein [Clostridium disporicum]|uniref:DnaJ domain protein n=1 Tax=Clostridium disporicum TaxID=84024 RepID=A0A174K4F2_9CLOT|nr:J domain-containing protein [Clostridium disporicum]CUP05711.1 DnaJ domain protein [Clostridium disporicum]
MEHYKILGVDENATMEEIKEAYDNKVKQFKEEIKDERRAKKFIEVFDKAYEEIKLEREKIQNQQTMIIDFKEADSIQELKDDLDKSEENFQCSIEGEEFDESEERSIVTKEKRKSNSKISSAKKGKSNNKKSSKTKDVENEKTMKKANKKVVVKNRKESSTIAKEIKLPFKLLAIPVIVVLTIILFLCKILNLISWIASKAIIIASIAGASIHGYQIYIGYAVQYKIFILCAIGFIVSLFLPSILRVLPRVLEGINNRLKRFVF